MGKPGLIRVKFPPETSEDNRLHLHPDSDRVITVIGGNGIFEAVRNNKLIQLPIRVGDRIWMPRGVIHTFRSGAEGLVVDSIHNPWVPLEEERALTYPEESTW